MNLDRKEKSFIIFFRKDISPDSVGIRYDLYFNKVINLFAVLVINKFKYIKIKFMKYLKIRGK